MVITCALRERFRTGAKGGKHDVNRLIKQFREAQKLFKMIQKTGGRGLPKMFG